MPERTEDVALRGILPITIGGQPVELRTLTLDESDAWLDLLASHLSAIEIPSESGEAAIKGALTAPAGSARVLVEAYDIDGTIPDIGKATKREIKDALEQMVSAEDPFGEGIAHSVARAYGAPAQVVAQVLSYVLAMPPQPGPSTTGASNGTGSTTGPSAGHGAESSSSSGGATHKTHKRSG